MRPVLFWLPFGYPVHGYGTMLCLSLIVGWHLTSWLGRKDGLDHRWMVGCFWWTAVSAIVWARLLYVITDPSSFTSVADVFRFTKGGFVAYGGFLGGLLGSALYCRGEGRKLLTWGDCVAPSLCTGLALTRIGCLLAGCDFGRPWDGAWAVQFPAGSHAFRQQLADGLLPAGAAVSLPVHPTQIYESLAGLVLLPLVLAVRRWRRAPGETLAAFAIGYAVLRFYIETLRADHARGAVGPLSTSQFIGVLTCLAGVALLVRVRRRLGRGPTAAG